MIKSLQEFSRFSAKRPPTFRAMQANWAASPRVQVYADVIIWYLWARILMLIAEPAKSTWGTHRVLTLWPWKYMLIRFLKATMLNSTIQIYGKRA